MPRIPVTFSSCVCSPRANSARACAGEAASAGVLPATTTGARREVPRGHSETDANWRPGPTYGVDERVELLRAATRRVGQLGGRCERCLSRGDRRRQDQPELTGAQAEQPVLVAVVQTQGGQRQCRGHNQPDRQRQTGGPRRAPPPRGAGRRCGGNGVLRCRGLTGRAVAVAGRPHRDRPATHRKHLPGPLLPVSLSGCPWLHQGRYVEGRKDGGGGIRTLETRFARLLVFKTSAFNRSATPPGGGPRLPRGPPRRWRSRERRREGRSGEHARRPGLRSVAARRALAA